MKVDIILKEKKTLSYLSEILEETESLSKKMLNNFSETLEETWFQKYDISTFKLTMYTGDMPIRL